MRVILLSARSGKKNDRKDVLKKYQIGCRRDHNPSTHKGRFNVIAVSGRISTGKEVISAS